MEWIFRFEQQAPSGRIRYDNFFSVAFPLSCFISKASHTNNSKCSVGHFQYVTRTKVPKDNYFSFYGKAFSFQSGYKYDTFLAREMPLYRTR